MAQPTSDLPVSVEEYLRLEETSAVKHEYVAGEVYALAGASKRHNEIAVNVATRLAAAARGGPCHATGGSFGPIVPAGGVAACDAARGTTKIAVVARASQSRRRRADIRFSMLSS